MIDREQQLFPFCIVWTVIPCISWLLPWIGHAGICDSNGVVSDFVGYRINKRKLSFGRPLKYVQLSEIAREKYDSSMLEVNEVFSRQGHNLCCNNCHHHVASVLNEVEYQGRRDWSQLSVWWLCISRSQFVDGTAIFEVYLPLLALVLLGIVWCYLARRH